MADLFTLVSTATGLAQRLREISKNVEDLAQRLREISKNVEDAEFKNALADLLSELADAKIEAADHKERLVELQTENTELKSRLVTSSESPPSSTDYGLYAFEGEDGLFCTACWDMRKHKIRTTRALYRNVARTCPVCKADYGR